MLVFVDMDGVVSDFDAHFKDNHNGRTFEELSESEQKHFWDNHCVWFDFFETSPPIQEGINMVNEIRKVCDVMFLSSTGGGVNHSNIAKQKITFLEKHGLGDLPMAFVTGTKSKASLADSQKLLIDDRLKVVDAYHSNGGPALLFTRDNWKSIVTTVKDYV